MTIGAGSFELTIGFFGVGFFGKGVGIMAVYRVKKKFPWRGEVTGKVAAVMKMFGLDVDRLKGQRGYHECSIDLRPGDICYITGASGAGKSVLLRQLYAAGPDGERFNLDDVKLEPDKSLIDCIEGDFFEGLSTLSKAGLSDVFCVLNSPDKLSEGQQYRYRLARALAAGRKMIFADEFCSNLDRITAAVISHNLRKLAKRTGTTFVLASSHEDVLCDLMPDIVVIKYLSGKTEVIYRKRKRQKQAEAGL